MARGRGDPASSRCSAAASGTGTASASTSPGSTAGLAVNAGFLVGHSTDPARGDGRRRDRASPPPPSRPQRWWRCCTSRSRPARSDSRRRSARGTLTATNRPVPSRARGLRRVRRAGRVHCATTRAPPSSSSQPWVRSPRDRMDLMADMSLAADRPLNWNLLGSLAGDRDLRRAARRVRCRGGAGGACGRAHPSRHDANAGKHAARIVAGLARGRESECRGPARRRRGSRRSTTTA